MEHLPLPHDCELAVDELVPFRCRNPRKDPYIRGPFKEFPQRDGKRHHVYLEQDPTWVGGDPTSRSYKGTFRPGREGLIQAWLFFGLLSETLQDSYKASDFIDIRPNGKVFVTTVALPRLFRQWRDRVLGCPDPDENAIKDLAKCLLFASEKVNDLHEKFNPLVKASIASVIQMFSLAIHHTSLSFTLNDLRPFMLNSNVPANNEELARMVRLGWCPRDIACLNLEWDSISARHFMSHLDVRSPSRNHDRCSPAHCCETERKDSDKYATCVENCNNVCSHVHINGNELTQMLEQGNIALLRLHECSTSGRIIASLVPLREGVPYVAISHVWSDGLGNPLDNSLPSCQISKLAALVRRMQPSIVEPSADLHIWLDTLCCPSFQGKGKTLALERIKETYQRAEAILVLDAGIACWNSHPMSSLEKLVRLITSGWCSRLWTLQEAVLASSIYVQFKDQAVNMDHCFDELSPSKDNCIRYGDAFIEVVIERYSRLRFLQELEGSGGESFWSDETDLSNIIQALRYRAVTEKFDEPLCLATLMRLPDTLARTAPNKRMAEFWKSLGKTGSGIPQYVAFLPRPQLSEEGLHWAPSSLLGLAYRGSEILISVDSTRMFGSLSNRGLEIRCPGATLSPAPVPVDSFDIPNRGATRASLNDVMYFRAAPNEWYLITKAYEGDKSLFSLLQYEGSLSRAIIWHPYVLPERLPSSLGFNKLPPSDALIVELHPSEGFASPIARIQRRVQVSRPITKVQRELERAHAFTSSIINKMNAKASKDGLLRCFSGERRKRKLNRELYKQLAAVSLNLLLESRAKEMEESSPLHQRGLETFFAVVECLAFGWYLQSDKYFPEDHMWCLG